MYAILSLDLDNVTSSQRKIFYESLKEDKWIKFNNLTTTWYVSFNTDATEEGIIHTSQNDVKKAATTAKVDKYNAMLTVSSSKPTEFGS